MKTHTKSGFGALILGTLLLTTGIAPGKSPASAPAPASARIPAVYGQLPLAFEPNQGQTDPQVRFLCRGAGYTLFFTDTGSVLALDAPKPVKTRAGKGTGAPARDWVGFTLLGAKSHPQIAAGAALPGRSNYFIGNDPGQWRTGIPQFARITSAQVYPGIDLVYYGNQRRLEYDFRVAPGADPSAIRLSIRGARSASLDSHGNLVLHLSGGDVIEQAPVIYQDINGHRKTVAGRYSLATPDPAQSAGTEVGFQLADYDRTRPLVIDPMLVYSTYLGGISTDSASGIAIDAAGDAYIVGTAASADFPTTVGVYQRKRWGGVYSVFVTKVDPAGSGLVYSTYIGGTSVTGDAGSSIAVDKAGDAYIAGVASSHNFPVTPGAFQKLYPGDGTDSTSGFITKLNPTGSALIYSTFLGGNEGMGGGDTATGIALDSASNTYITGAAGPGFPVTKGAYQTVKGGDFGVGYVTKLNATGSKLVYSTFVAESTYATQTGAVAVDGTGSAYVAGYLYPANINDEYTNPMIVKLNPAGTKLLYGTYLASNFWGAADSIAVDGSAQAYVTGYTQATNFLVTAGAFQTTRPSAYATNCPFVSKLNKAGTELLYSTYLGGSSGETGNAIAVDGTGSAVVTGKTVSTNFPTMNPTQPNVGGSEATNVFITKLNATGSALLFSTYLGGRETDSGNGVALDADGNIYVAGDTSSTGFPVRNAYQSVLHGSLENAFVAKLNSLVKADFNNDGHPDLLLQNVSTHDIAASLLTGTNGTKLITTYYFAPPLLGDINAQLVGVGDFNQKGHQDLVWQDYSTGKIGVAYLAGTNGLTITGTAPIAAAPAGWHVAGIGEFNDDNHPDLVLQNVSTHAIVFWILDGTNGTTVAGTANLSPLKLSDTNAVVVGVGDLVGNGHQDLVWQDYSTGKIGVAYLGGTDGNSITSTAIIGVVPLAWHVTGVDDINNDGHPDLVLQDTATGNVETIFLTGTNGTTVGATAIIGNPGLKWQVRNR